MAKQVHRPTSRATCSSPRGTSRCCAIADLRYERGDGAFGVEFADPALAAAADSVLQHNSRPFPRLCGRRPVWTIPSTSAEEHDARFPYFSGIGRTPGING
jgi:hypothetical protein